MKQQATLFTLLVLFFFTNSHSQPYLNETARWTQSYNWTGFSANSTCRSLFYIQGDSTINDTSYYKVFSNVVCLYTQTNYDSLGNPFQLTDTSTSNSLALLLREEDRKFITRIGIQESQLYNFNLIDFTPITEAVLNPICGLSNPSLMTHDTICIGNSIRKRWQISPSQYPLATYFIEGVGPSSGFNAPICRNGCPECSYSLNFFELNGDTLYTGSCLLLSTAPQDELSVKINQTAESIQFSSTELIQIELITLQGKCMGIFNALQGSASIASSNLSMGIYLYKAITNDGIFGGKFLITR